MTKRDAIIQLHCAGIAAPSIIKQLNVAKSTVYDTISHYKELGNSNDRPRTRRPRTAQTPERIKAVRERIRRNLKRSMRLMAKQMSVSKSSMRTIVKKDLGFSPLKIRKKHLLTAAQKRKRLERSKKILNYLKDGTKLGDVIFSNEKLFTVEAKTNKQNDRVLANSSKDVSEELTHTYHCQNPTSVMVWGAVSKTWKSPLIFVERGVKINTESYINAILTSSLEEMKKHFKDAGFTFQQDGAPSHTSNKTQQWCKTNFPNFSPKNIWPSSSPDLNPMDFSIWSILEKNSCAMPHSTLESLKKTLVREWEKIPQKTIRAAVESFRGRIERVIALEGGHIEK